MRRHRHRQIVQGAKRSEISALQGFPVGVDHRQIVVSVHGGTAMPGHMLEHRQHALGQMRIGNGAGNRGNLNRIRAIAAVLQKRMRLVGDQIGHRRAIGVDPHRTQFAGNHPVTQRHHPRRIRPRRLHHRQGRHPLAPMRAAQPLHPPAFLINQDRGIAPDRRAQITGQAAQLVWRFDIAREDDKAERVDVGKERAFILLQHRPGAAKDCCPKPKRAHRWATGMQTPLSTRSAAQNRRDSSSVSKPCARSLKKVRPPLWAS